MTKTKSHWFRMIYIEVQDKKTQVRDEKNELQAVSLDWYSINRKSFDWYSIDRKLHISKKSTNVKSL